MLIRDTQERCQITERLHVAAFPKLHGKPWSRGEEKALLQFVCLHEDRNSPSLTAVGPSMNPSDPFWNEAAQYIRSTTAQSHLRTGIIIV